MRGPAYAALATSPLILLADARLSSTMSQSDLIQVRYNSPDKMPDC